MIKYILLSFGFLFLFTGCTNNTSSQGSIPQTQPAKNQPEETSKLITQDTMNKDNKIVSGQQVATFAGGCFWCIEAAFQEQEGVVSAVSGFTGGDEKNPSYKDVATGKTTHREAVEITYDPQVIDYKRLLEIFWTSIDPTDNGGQFADRGYQYTTAIYYHTPEQKNLAEKSVQALEDLKKFEDPIATEILPSQDFYAADESHQDFYKKSSEYYKRYKIGSGRQGFIDENWAKTFFLELEEEKEQEDAEVKSASSYDLSPEEIEERLKTLDPLSYHVVTEGGTESPFENAYWDNKADGIYVDKVSGDPLFSSTHKYDSGTGWPSFYKTLQEESVIMKEDNKLAVPRTEIVSAKAGSHLGHVFDDGPEDKGGQRFCTNSASLLFIPKEEMAEKGYEEWLYLFE